MSDYLPEEIVWLPPMDPEPEPVPDILEISDVAPTEELPDVAWDLLVMAIGRSMLSSYPFAHFGGYVEPKILHGALCFYLQLQSDEHLLAVIDPTKGRYPMRGCAFTTRRIYWANPTPTTTREELFATCEGGQPPYERSASYEELDLVGPDGVLTVGGEAIGRLKFSWRRAHVKAAVIEVLNTLIQAAQCKERRPRLSPREEERARRDLRAVTRRTNECLETQGQLKKLPAILRVVVPKIYAVPLLMLLNITYYLIMISSGVNPLMRDAGIALTWGGNFGPKTITEGEWWRLFSSMFLHFGFLHLASNMLILLWLGRLVERLFGSRGFLALYLLSGVAGSIASVWSHPMVVSAGASGAVFGMAGGLFGYLAARRDIAPRSLLQIFSPVVVIYLTFDSLLGLVWPGIDAAAHIGGFGGGFVAGLLLSRPWPPPLEPKGVIRRLVGGSAMALGLAWLFIWLQPRIETRMQADPRRFQFLGESEKNLDIYNRFHKPLDPLLDEYNGIDDDFREILGELEARPLLKFLLIGRVTRLKNRAQTNRDRLVSLPGEDADLKRARTDIVEAQVHYIQSIEAVERYIKTGKDVELEGPEGVIGKLKAASESIDSFNKRVDDYLKLHDLQTLEPDEEEEEEE